MALRVVRVSAEVFGTTATGDMRVTRLLAEVAGQTEPDLRLYRLAQQVLLERGAIEIDQSLIFGQSESLTKEVSVSGSSGLVFSQKAWIGYLVEQTLNFSDSAPVPGQTKHQLATSGFTFSQAATANVSDQTISQNLIFSHSAETPNPQPYVRSVSQSLIFSDSAAPGNLAPKVAQGLIFGHNVVKAYIGTGGLIKFATGSLIFSHDVQKVKILAGATAVSATQSLVFSDRSLLPLDFHVQQSAIFTQSAIGDYVWRMEQELLFDHEESIAGSVWPQTATQGVIFSHAFAMDRDDVSLCTYDPIVGDNTIPEAPTPPSATAPTLTPSSTVTLFYPTTSPTLTVQIRAPEIGDRDRLQALRINRESRGGTLQVFADTTWPEIQILSLQFTGLTEAEASSIQSFFQQTLGLEVGFTDWEGRTWHGIITTPDEPLIRSRRGIVDISFEFDGELQ